MSQYFPKPFRSFGGHQDVKVHLSNYAKKKKKKKKRFKKCDTR